MAKNDFRARVRILGVDDVSSVFNSASNSAKIMEASIGSSVKKAGGVFTRDFTPFIKDSQTHIKNLHKEQTQANKVLKDIESFKKSRESYKLVGEQLKNTQSKIKDATNEIKRLSLTSKELAEVNRNEKKELTALKNEIEKATSVYGKESAEVKNLKDRKKELENQIKETSREIRRNKKDISTNERELTGLRQEISFVGREYKKTTEKMKGNQKALKESGVNIGNISKEYEKATSKSQEFERQLEKEKRALESLRVKQEKIIKAKQKRDRDIGRGANVAIAGAVSYGAGQKILGAASEPIEVGAQMQRSMSKVRARLLQDYLKVEKDDSGNVIKATLDKQGKTVFNRLEGIANIIGGTTQYKAFEVAEGIEEMGKAGVKVQSITEESMRSLMNVAKAGDNMAIAEAVSTTAGIINAFGDDVGKSMTRYGDILVNVTGSSSATMQEMKDTFKDAAPVAADYGLKFKDLAAMATLLAKVNIKGSVASTAMKNSILALGTPTTSAMNAFDELGISVEDSEGKLKKAPVLLKEIAKAIKEGGYSEKEAKALKLDIVGRESLSGFSALLNASNAANDGLSDLDKMIIKMDKDSEGLSAAIASTISDDYQGKVAILGSSWDRLQTILFNQVSPALEGIIELGTDVVTGIADFAENNEWLGTTLGVAAFGIGGLLTAAGGVMATVGPLITGVAGLNYLLSVTAINGGLASTALGGLGVKGLLVGGAIGKITAIGGMVMTFFKGVLIPGIIKVGGMLLAAIGPIGWAIAAVGAIGAAGYGLYSYLSDDEEETKKEKAKGDNKLTPSGSSNEMPQIPQEYASAPGAGAIGGKKVIQFGERAIVIEAAGMSENRLRDMVRELLEELIEEKGLEREAQYAG